VAGTRAGTGAGAVVDAEGVTRAGTLAGTRPDTGAGAEVGAVLGGLTLTANGRFCPGQVDRHRSNDSPTAVPRDLSMAASTAAKAAGMTIESATGTRVGLRLSTISGILSSTAT